MIRKAILIISVTLIPLYINAAENSEDKKLWSSSIGISYLTSSGNSDSQTLSTEAFAIRKSEKHELELKVGNSYGNSDNEKITDYWYLSSKYSRNITKKAYFLFFTGMEGNRPAGYITRLTVSPGIGYRFLDGRHELKGEAGPGYMHEDRLYDENLSYTSGIAYLLYKFNMNDKSYFSQDTEYMHNFENYESYRLNANTSLTFVLSDKTSFKTGVKVQYVNQPPLDTEKTDVFTFTSLIFNF